MDREVPCKPDEIARLRIKVAHLEDANRFTLEALAVAARLGDFKLASNTFPTPESILKETASRAGELIRFKGMALFLMGEDSMRTSPAYSDRSNLHDFFLGEFERLTADHTLARSLQRKQSTIVAGADKGEHLLLHPVSSSEKTVGFFIGLLDEDPQTILDTSLSILSIMFLNSANTLENLALKNFKEVAQKDLEAKVEHLNLEIERRKNSEKGLQSARNFLNEVINAVPEPIFVKDKNYCLLMVNDAFCSFMALDRADLLGKTSYDLLPRKDAEISHRADARIMLSGEEDTHEGLITSVDGRRHFVSVKKACLVDPETFDNVLVGIIRNLTDQKRSEKLLNLERERFFSLLEHLPAFVYVHNHDYTTEYGNAAFRKQFGNCEGKKCFDLFHGEDGPCDDCSSRKSIDTSQPVVENREYPNGKTFQIYTHPFDDPDGSRKVVVMGIDITDRNKAIKALAESESKYRVLVENANSLIIRWTGDGRLTFFNEYAQTFFGYTSEEVIGKQMVGTIVPVTESTGRDLGPLMEEIADYPNAFTQNENENIRSDGKRVWVSWSNRGIYDDAGDLTEILSVGTDISARVLMEKELLKAKNEAEIASKAKSEFLANMSHEIRTPLNGVLGMLQLASIASVDGDVGDYIEVALESGRSLLTVINDILDVSKIEAGRLEVEQSCFSPRQVVDSVVRTFAHQAKETGITLNSDVADTVPEVLIGDGGRIRQVLFNLVGNSMKFTNHGSVSVSISSIQASQEHFRRLLFIVKDTGIGIPEDKVQYIFDAFTQVDGSYQRKYQGSGLGLGIVKRLVHLMDGTLFIDTTLDQGTTIAFALDMRVVTQEVLPIEKKGVDSDFDPTLFRLLMAEDNRVNQIMARKGLERVGFFVNCCFDGVEALDALSSEPYDCVLLDIQMPVMDGLEAAKRIRNGEAGETNKDIPLIALTAHALRSDRDRFLASGMDAVVAKPFEMEDLVCTIAELLAGKGD